MYSSVSPKPTGRFVDHVNSKKGGPFSPVKRSHRINPNHEIVADTNHDLLVAHSQTLAVDRGSNKAIRFLSPDKVGTDKKIAAVYPRTPVAAKMKKEADDIQELCSVFQTTLKVDNTTLKVEASKMKRVSPLPKPKEGRFTTMVPQPAGNGSDVFLAVKRSLRSINKGK